jgi:hypothetical protein
MSLQKKVKLETTTEPVKSEENLESLEHFEDDLNLNIHNQRLVKNFIRVGKAISKNLKSFKLRRSAMLMFAPA